MTATDEELAGTADCPGEEQRLRVDLAAAYRLIALFAMDDVIYTHISARLPGNEERFLLNPYGRRFDEVTASGLVTIDLDGRLVDDPDGSGINPAGFTIHSAVHAARPDVVCVLHTHTVAGVAVSCLAGGLMPLNQWALQFHERLAYHDYEGIALDHDERARLVADLGVHRAMILRNHGLLTCGRSVAEAFKLMYNLERSCRAQLAAQASGATLVLPPPAVREKTARQYESAYDSVEAAGPAGDREWSALLRLLDQRSPGYAV